MASPSPPAAEVEEKTSPQIPAPRRLLILSTAAHSSAIIPPLLYTLTGVPVTAPPPQPEPAPKSALEADTDTATTPSDGRVATATLSFAGYTSHSPLRLQTKYYTADIPIWVDEVPYSGPGSGAATTATTTATAASAVSSTDTDTKEKLGSGSEAGESATATTQSLHPSTWKSEFLTDEARVVRDAIGAIIICLPSQRNSVTNTTTSTGTGTTTGEADALKEIVEAVGGVRDLMEEERGGVGDVPGLVVLVGKRGEKAKEKEKQRQKREVEVDDGEEGQGVGDPELTWWEESLLELGVFGWEVIGWDPKEEGVEGRRNQFGGRFYASPIFVRLSCCSLGLQLLLLGRTVC